MREIGLGGVEGYDPVFLSLSISLFLFYYREEEGKEAFGYFYLFKWRLMIKKKY